MTRRSRFPQRIPSEPIRRMVKLYARDRGLHTVEQLAIDLAISTRTIARLFAAETIDFRTADRFALALGLHPLLLYPDKVA